MLKVFMALVLHNSAMAQGLSSNKYLSCEAEVTISGSVFKNSFVYPVPTCEPGNTCMSVMKKIILPGACRRLSARVRTKLNKIEIKYWPNCDSTKNDTFMRFRLDPTDSTLYFSDEAKETVFSLSCQIQ